MVLSMNRYPKNKITYLFLIIFISTVFCDPDTTTRNAQTSTKKVSSVTTPATLSTATNIQTTVCKDNSSCNTNSTVFATTTALPTTTLFSTIANKNKTAPGLGGDATPAKKPKAQSLEEVCICNLKVDYCDINCCCDSDCSFENKLAFGHCEPDFHHYDTRFCQYMKHRYINKTSSKVQVNQDGFFCVIPNNVPQSYLIQKKLPLKSFSEASFQKGNKYSWPDLVSNSKLELNNYYTYGKVVWLLQNNVLNTVGYIKSFVASNCLVKEEVKFLIDIKSTCSHTDISEANRYLNSDTYFKNSSIITNPSLFNSSEIVKNTIVQKCPKGACIKMNPKVCDMFFENCIDYNKFKIDFGLRCGMKSTSKMLFCLNLVKHVRYNFYHNGTYGIQRADVLLHLVNETFPNDDIEFPQTFEVNFIWWNHVLNYSSFLSGNPGYLVGKPILSAHIVTINTTISDNPATKNVSMYFYENRIFRDPQDCISNFLVLPHANENGNCELNKHQYTSIEFGINTYQKCSVSEHTPVKNISEKSICLGIQKKIFHYWSLNVTNDTLANKLVGQFGNANIFKLDDWVKVLFQEDLKTIFNKTTGVFNNKTATLTCLNMTTSLTIEIFHSRIDFDDVINQEKILGVTYTFGNVKNFTFPLQVTESNLNFRIKIVTKVAFFDITTKKIRKIVDPPTLNIRLPHDFFYPFVKLDNAGRKNSLSYVLLYGILISVTILY